MEESTIPPETIRQLIVRLTNQAWNERSEGILLAELGSEVAQRKEAAAAELAGRNLSDFIKAELQESIKIVAPIQQPISKLAFPKTAPVDERNAWHHMRHADPLRKASNAAKVTGAILLAFSKPVPPEHKRVITLEPKVRFDDILETASQPENTIALDPKWIVLGTSPQDADQRSLQVMANIAAWRKSIDLDAKALAKPAAERESRGKTFLEELLSSLTEADQKRIQIPLDIVAKLHNRSTK